MERGIVKWFSNAKGYGFINYRDDEEIFVHFTAIQTDGYKTLNKDDAVLFEVKKAPLANKLPTSKKLISQQPFNKRDSQSQAKKAINPQFEN